MDWTVTHTDSRKEKYKAKIAKNYITISLLPIISVVFEKDILSAKRISISKLSSAKRTVCIWKAALGGGYACFCG